MISNPCRRGLRACFIGIGMAMLAGQVFAQGPAAGDTCSRRAGAVRQESNAPEDYRRGGSRLRMVEDNHFNVEVEQLIRGKTGPVGSDLDFVLHFYPNHHRALVSVSRYGLRERSATPGNMAFSVDCYFIRAMRFKPDDHIVQMLFADYLGKTKRPGDAVAYLDAVAAGPEGSSPLTAYNLGLLYLDLGQHEKALAQAHKAMANGNLRTGLADALRTQKKWVDPAAPPPASSAPMSDSARQ